MHGVKYIMHFLPSQGFCSIFVSLALPWWKSPLHSCIACCVSFNRDETRKREREGGGSGTKTMSRLMHVVLFVFDMQYHHMHRKHLVKVSAKITVIYCLPYKTTNNKNINNLMKLWWRLILFTPINAHYTHTPIHEIIRSNASVLPYCIWIDMQRWR